jgi:hypothetical protein
MNSIKVISYNLLHSQLHLTVLSVTFCIHINTYIILYRDARIIQ